MQLRDYSFLTDENMQADVVSYLQGQGLDVLDVKENGLTGSSDLDLMRLAYSQSRVILTHDSDFGALAIAGGEPFLGIVYLRPGHIRPAFTVGTLDAVFA